MTIVAIGTAAQSSKIDFGPYVEHTMETLFKMPELVDPARFELRASITDTFAFIASAAGTDIFQDHFERTFKFAFEGLKIGAPRLREAAFCFFSIMAEVLKDKMAFTLPDIMPHLIKTLAQDELGVDTEIVKENGDYNAANLIEKLGNIDYHANFIEHSKLLEASSDSEDDESIDINVNSALLLEKVVAAEAVGELCKHIGEAFFPYLAETTSILVEMADSYFQGGQKAALGALWKFVMTLGKIQVTEDWQPGLPVVCGLFPSVLTLENTPS
jgi:importin-4